MHPYLQNLATTLLRSNKILESIVFIFSIHYETPMICYCLSTIYHMVKIALLYCILQMYEYSGWVSYVDCSNWWSQSPVLERTIWQNSSINSIIYQSYHSTQYLIAYDNDSLIGLPCPRARRSTCRAIVTCWSWRQTSACPALHRTHYEYPQFVEILVCVQCAMHALKLGYMRLYTLQCTLQRVFALRSGDNQVIDL